MVVVSRAALMGAHPDPQIAFEAVAERVALGHGPYHSEGGNSFGGVWLDFNPGCLNIADAGHSSQTRVGTARGAFGSP